MIWNQNHFFLQNDQNQIIPAVTMKVKKAADWTCKNTRQPPIDGVKLILATVTNPSILQEVKSSSILSINSCRNTASDGMAYSWVVFTTNVEEALTGAQVGNNGNVL